MRGAAELAEEAQGPPLENTTFPACANGQGGGGHEQQPLRPQGEARLGTKTRGPLEKHLKGGRGEEKMLLANKARLLLPSLKPRKERC